MTWFRSVAFKILRAAAGWRTATRTFIPSPARRRTSRRPRNPEPPNTTTVVMAYLLRQAGLARPTERRPIAPPLRPCEHVVPSKARRRTPSLLAGAVRATTSDEDTLFI